ncbi:uncharacterized protein LOC112081510 [Eutrema salsugineum]|uniref:uncharacterized protein LOC112081510 n=1 Tax=Eutrema salsugineum TaxID=72664 RepID=UPI000CECF91A|nr:uncharacterized protein LOC112081510 [Eutrema salsugineum]
MPSYISESSEEILYWAYADAIYGIPEKCFCGRVVKLKANAAGRKYYACPEWVNEATFDHIHQWWDDGVTEQFEILVSRIEQQKDLILSVDQSGSNVLDPAIGEIREELSTIQGEVREEISTLKGEVMHLKEQLSTQAALKEKSSGQNDNGVMKLAHEIFFNDYGIKFGLEHAWRELRHDQKWCTSGKAPDGASSKRRKVADSAQSTTSMPASENDQEFEAHPPEVKASKASVKKSASAKADNKDMKKFSSMWEMKQRDLELKDKIRDKRILESLLAKTEPLNEIDMALKTKLIRAIYDL